MTLPGLMSLMYVYTVRAHKHEAALLPWTRPLFWSQPPVSVGVRCRIHSLKSSDPWTNFVHTQTAPVVGLIECIKWSTAQPSTGSNLLLLDRLRCIFRATYLLQIRRPPTSRPHSIHHERGIHITQSGTYISSSELSHSTRHQTYGYVIKPNFLYWMILLDASWHAAWLFSSYLTSLPGPLRNQCWFSDISASSWSSAPAVTGTKQPWFRGSGLFWYSTMEGLLKGLPPRRDGRKSRTLIRFHNLTAETRACAVVRVEYMMITVRKWNAM